jgi:ABC-2 type transport system ATP-binding protein
MENINLTVKNVSFTLNNHIILDDMSFDVTSKLAITLLGPNGAGKSTLLKALAASLFATQGSIEFMGKDSQSQRQSYLELVGYMPETPLLMPELTVKEQLQLVARLKNCELQEELIEQCQLGRVVNKRCNQLSLGYRQRLNLAGALINKPKLLIMDEPLNGLDPHLIIEFRRIIKKLKKDTIVIMSTHYLAEAQMVSDRVLIMQQGKLLDDVIMQTDTDLEELYLQHTRIQESV